MRAEAAPIEVASRLMREAGLADAPRALARLAGGRNNRVYRVEREGPPLVIKCYHHDARDPRDRLGAEWAFLRYAWDACGLRDVPHPLAAGRASHTALYTFVPGGRIAAAEARHVETAARFVGALNTIAARGGAERLARRVVAGLGIEQAGGHVVGDGDRACGGDELPQPILQRRHEAARLARAIAHRPRSAIGSDSTMPMVSQPPTR